MMKLEAMGSPENSKNELTTPDSPSQEPAGGGSGYVASAGSDATPHAAASSFFSPTTGATSVATTFPSVLPNDLPALLRAPPGGLGCWWREASKAQRAKGNSARGLYHQQSHLSRSHNHKHRQHHLNRETTGARGVAGMMQDRLDCKQLEQLIASLASPLHDEERFHAHTLASEFFKWRDALIRANVVDKERASDSNEMVDSNLDHSQGEGQCLEVKSTSESDKGEVSITALFIMMLNAHVIVQTEKFKSSQSFADVYGLPKKPERLTAGTLLKVLTRNLTSDDHLIELLRPIVTATMREGGAFELEQLVTKLQEDAITTLHIQVFEDISYTARERSHEQFKHALGSHAWRALCRLASQQIAQRHAFPSELALCTSPASATEISRAYLPVWFAPNSGNTISFGTVSATATSSLRSQASVSQLLQAGTLSASALLSKGGSDPTPLPNKRTTIDLSDLPSYSRDQSLRPRLSYLDSTLLNLAQRKTHRIAKCRLTLKHATLAGVIEVAQHGSRSQVESYTLRGRYEVYMSEELTSPVATIFGTISSGGDGDSVQFQGWIYAQDRHYCVTVIPQSNACDIPIFVLQTEALAHHSASTSAMDDAVDAEAQYRRGSTSDATSASSKPNLSGFLLRANRVAEELQHLANKRELCSPLDPTQPTAPCENPNVQKPATMRRAPVEVSPVLRSAGIRYFGTLGANEHAHESRRVAMRVSTAIDQPDAAIVTSELSKGTSVLDPQSQAEAPASAALRLASLEGRKGSRSEESRSSPMAVMRGLQPSAPIPHQQQRTSTRVAMSEVKVPHSSGIYMKSHTGMHPSRALEIPRGRMLASQQASKSLESSKTQEQETDDKRDNNLSIVLSANASEPTRPSPLSTKRAITNVTVSAGHTFVIDQAGGGSQPVAASSHSSGVASSGLKIPTWAQEHEATQKALSMLIESSQRFVAYATSLVRAFTSAATYVTSSSTSEPSITRLAIPIQDLPTAILTLSYEGQAPENINLGFIFGSSRVHDGAPPITFEEFVTYVTVNFYHEGASRWPPPNSSTLSGLAQYRENLAFVKQLVEVFQCIDVDDYEAVDPALVIAVVDKWSQTVTEKVHGITITPKLVVATFGHIEASDHLILVLFVRMLLVLVTRAAKLLDQ